MSLMGMAMEMVGGKVGEQMGEKGFSLGGSILSKIPLLSSLPGIKGATDSVGVKSDIADQLGESFGVDVGQIMNQVPMPGLGLGVLGQDGGQAVSQLMDLPGLGGAGPGGMGGSMLGEALTAAQPLASQFAGNAEGAALSPGMELGS